LIHKGNFTVLWRLVPERLVADGTLTPRELLEPVGVTLDDLLRVHTPEYVHAVINGTLTRQALLRLGLPWSPALVRRAFAKERSSWDIALPDGTGDEHYLDIPSRALPQLLARFRPDLLFYQAGVDVLAGDRFGRLA
jgi:acetoin utilization deacetylase AcuC-like enzyme